MCAIVPLQRRRGCVSYFAFEWQPTWFSMTPDSQLMYANYSSNRNLMIQFFLFRSLVRSSFQFVVALWFFLSRMISVLLVCLLFFGSVLFIGDIIESRRRCAATVTSKGLETESSDYWFIFFSSSLLLLLLRSFCCFTCVYEVEVFYLTLLSISIGFAIIHSIRYSH